MFFPRQSSAAHDHPYHDAALSQDKSEGIVITPYSFRFKYFVVMGKGWIMQLLHLEITVKFSNVLLLNVCSINLWKSMQEYRKFEIQIAYIVYDILHNIFYESHLIIKFLALIFHKYI